MPRATAIACSFVRRSEFVITRLTALGIGALMNVRGLMELIISIGLQRGIITPTLFAILVVMAIVTTLMATPRFEWTRRKPGITKAAPAD